MGFDLKTCKIIVWGMKDRYCTHSHIHEAIYRAAKHMRPNSEWLDVESNFTNVDWHNTLVITEHKPSLLEKLPIRDDVFYVVHGMNDNAPSRERFQNVKLRLSWNVFHDYSHVYGTQGNPVSGTAMGVPVTDVMWLGEDTPLYPNENHMDFRWATDLLPHEIEANKPKQILGRDAKTIHYIGTQWWVNQVELNQFDKACKENHICFQPSGAGQVMAQQRHPIWGIRVASIEENMRLVRESFMAPALSGSHHLTEGYVPCRIFKNISYGQPYVTNNLRAHQVLEQKGIFNPDPYKLFYDARDILKEYPLDYLYAQMDLVARKHTYINRIEGIMKAAAIIQAK